MYNIEALSMMTGLTSRTLRNYLKSGILQGSKETGIWQFTDQQVEDFIANPTVSPSIRAKRNAIVYDFLADQDQTENELCLLLNRTASRLEAEKLSSYFCTAVSQLNHVRFSYAYENGKARFILKGREEDIRELIKNCP